MLYAELPDDGTDWCIPPHYMQLCICDVLSLLLKGHSYTLQCLTEFCLHSKFNTLILDLSYMKRLGYMQISYYRSAGRYSSVGAKITSLQDTLLL